MAPVGVQQIFHEDKETGLSEVCSEIGVPYILSTASSSSIEEVAKSNGKGPRWFQLYWPQDDDVTISLLKRAKANGYKVLVVTLDTWALACKSLFRVILGSGLVALSQDLLEHPSLGNNWKKPANSQISGDRETS